MQSAETDIDARAASTSDSRRNADTPLWGTLERGLMVDPAWTRRSVELSDQPLYLS